MLELLFALLLTFTQVHEDDSYSVGSYYGCISGGLCENRPNLPEVNSPFRYTGETPNLTPVPPMAQFGGASPVFEHFLTEDNK